MKFRINAGAEVDLLTPSELKSELKALQASWMGELARGDRFRNISTFGDASGAGALSIGDGGAGTRLGPDPGFAWSVTRLALSAGFDPASHTAALFLNAGTDNLSGLVHPDLAGYNSFSGNELVLYPGASLVVVGTATASTRVWLTGQVREYPISLAWRM